MKLNQLHEAEVPAWVKKLDSDYKHLLRSTGFEDRTAPKPEKRHDKRGRIKGPDNMTMWQFGNFIRPREDNVLFSKDEQIDMGKIALPGEIAKFLIQLAKDHPNRLVRTVQHYGWWRQPDRRIINGTDPVGLVTSLVRDALGTRGRTTGSYLDGKQKHNELNFTWEIDPPREFSATEPQPPRKVVRIVKKAAA